MKFILANLKMKKIRLTSICAATIALWIVLLPLTTNPQTPCKQLPPCGESLIYELKILESLKTRALTQQLITCQIRKCGVNFQMTPKDESELTAAGANPELIRTIKANYRGSLKLLTVNPTVGPTSRPTKILLSGKGITPGAKLRIQYLNKGRYEETEVGTESVSADGTQMTAILPEHTEGDVTIVVANPTGESATLVNSFKYAIQPLKVLSEQKRFSIPESYGVPRPSGWNEIFSNDGKRSAYVVRSLSREFVVMDGVKLAEFDGVDSLIFSPDGTKLAYRAKEIVGIGAKYVIKVIDQSMKEYSEQKTPKFPDIKSPQFSLDSRKLFYWAQIEETRNWWVIAVTDNDSPNESLDGSSNVPIGSVALASDGYYAYVSQIQFANGNAQYLSLPANRRTDLADKYGQPTFAPTGHTLAYSIFEFQKWSLCLFDFRSPHNCKDLLFDDAKTPVEQIGTLLFSPDGSKLAYVVKQNGASFVALGSDRVSERYEEIKDLTFSPDGRQLAFAAKEQGKWSVVVDSKKQQRFDLVGDLVFSPDGNSFAYTAQQANRQFIVINDERTANFDKVGRPQFAANGKEVVFGARRERDFLRVVVEAP